MDYSQVVVSLILDIKAKCKCRDEAVALAIETLKKYDNDFELRRCIEHELNKNGYNITIASTGGYSDVETRKLQNYIWEAHKSKENTDKLINFIQRYPDDAQVLFASWHALKIKHLIALGLLCPTDAFIQNENLSIKEAMFLSNDREVEQEVYECLYVMGFHDIHSSWFLFRLRMEKILYSIELNDSVQGYKRVNTIKVALNILKKDFLIHEVNGKMKPQYFDNIAKYFNESMKLIDKEIVKFYLEDWGCYTEEFMNGYLVLLNLLKCFV